MRVMDIPKFPKIEEFGDLGALLQDRLTRNEAKFSEQSIGLISYMAWPNDEIARRRWVEVQSGASFRELQGDHVGDTNGVDSEISDHPHWALSARDDRPFLSKLKLIQKHWLRIADILHLHYDMSQGGHQKHRGGPSLSKAIDLVATNAEVKGTGRSKLWQIWEDYKDVAHLVLAAILVSDEANRLGRERRWHLPKGRLQPLHVIDLLPDLVLAVAQSLETYGLEAPVHGSDDPLFDPVTLWRIPAGIGLPPVPPPVRKLRRMDIVTLNERRAGHRGRHKGPFKATPVFDQGHRLLKASTSICGPRPRRGRGCAVRC
jgi:hypothetical protein